MVDYRYKFLALHTEDGCGTYTGEIPVSMDGSSDYTWTVWMFKKQENDDDGCIWYVDDGCGLYVHGNAAAYEMEGYSRVETNPVLMLMCGKVTTCKLIDSSRLFRISA